MSSLSLYLHLPFCRVHCTYCPFAISTDLTQQEAYVEALLREIEAAPRAEVETIYFGGGTPSRTGSDHLARVMARLRGQFDIRPDAEISLEANPEDVTAESVDAWRAMGMNRISIGVQSFHDGELAAIGRIHGRQRAIEAVRTAAGSGLRTNLDIILGLPGQTDVTFRETLEQATDLGAGHISLYMLDLEEKTPLQVQVARGRIDIPEDDFVATQYLRSIEVLAARGLMQYEVSNFARAGEECRHNLRYWTRGEYHGFGMGAHSFVGERRFANTRDIRQYIASSPGAGDFTETLGSDEIRRERLLLGLRRTWGIHYEDFAQLGGEEGAEWMERGLRDGWLRRVGDRIALTPTGFLSSNEFISQLF